MKRIAILCWILLLSMQGITAAGKLPFPLPEAKTGGVDTDISYTSGDMTYVFGSDGEGLIKVEKNGVEIYDFGRRPAWFLLKYMLQEKISGIVKTRPMYYYPQVGSDNLDPVRKLILSTF